MSLLNALRSAARAVLAVLCLASPAFAATPRTAPAATTPASPKSKPAAPSTGATQTATFAGGCFWCEETTFEGLPGVLSVRSGYTGGNTVSPSYEEVSSGVTGHAEAVEIVFDPLTTSYAALLDVFWRNIDPTQKDAQFCDHGRQYRSAIFHHDAAQKRLAEASRHRIETMPRRFAGKIVTEIVPAGVFYPAEEYHQDFYRKNPTRYREYREGCGRDRRLKELWGEPPTPIAH